MSSRVLPQFEFLTPQNVPEAVDMLKQYQGSVSILAGGTDLLVWNYIRKINPAALLSLSSLPELDCLEFTAEGLRIGARTKVSRLLTSPVIAEKYPALHEAAFTFATPQIRNRATVVGNIMRGSPAGDCSCAVLALGGQVVLEGPEGRRAVDIDDFWVGYGETARRCDELAVELQIPAPGPGTRSAFHRLTRVHEDLAKINVAVRLEMDGGFCRQARIAMGCVGPTLMRLKQTETVLSGAPLNEETLLRAAESARDEIAPIDDQRSTADYRRQVAGVILRRVIERAAEGRK
jgi:carbon-monoxide dehydrogenase medium subunit